MARRTGSRNKRTLEYVGLYERLRRKYCDPTEVLFAMASGIVPAPAGVAPSADGPVVVAEDGTVLEVVSADIRLRAAATLVKQRFPQVKAVEVHGVTGEVLEAGAEAGQLTLAWDTRDAEDETEAERDAA